MHRKADREGARPHFLNLPGTEQVAIFPLPWRRNSEQLRDPTLKMFNGFRTTMVYYLFTSLSKREILAGGDGEYDRAKGTAET
jgi:hypothetical protein